MNECVNCCVPLNVNTKVVGVKLVSAANTTTAGPALDLTVTTALNYIYQVSGKQIYLSNDTGPVSQLGLCFPCWNIVIQLYQLHRNLNVLTKVNSVLNKAFNVLSSAVVINSSSTVAEAPVTSVTGVASNVMQMPPLVQSEKQNSQPKSNSRIDNAQKFMNQTTSVSKTVTPGAKSTIQIPNPIRSNAPTAKPNILATPGPRVTMSKTTKDSTTVTPGAIPTTQNQIRPQISKITKDSATVTPCTKPSTQNQIRPPISVANPKAQPAPGPGPRVVIPQKTSAPLFSEVDGVRNLESKLVKIPESKTITPVTTNVEGSRKNQMHLPISEVTQNSPAPGAVKTPISFVDIVKKLKNQTTTVPPVPDAVKTAVQISKVQRLLLAPKGSTTITTRSLLAPHQLVLRGPEFKFIPETKTTKDDATIKPKVNAKRVSEEPVRPNVPAKKMKVVTSPSASQSAGAEIPKSSSQAQGVCVDNASSNNLDKKTTNIPESQPQTMSKISLPSIAGPDPESSTKTPKKPNILSSRASPTTKQPPKPSVYTLKVTKPATATTQEPDSPMLKHNPRKEKPKIRAVDAGPDIPEELPETLEEPAEIDPVPVPPAAPSSFMQRILRRVAEHLKPPQAEKPSSSADTPKSVVKKKPGKPGQSTDESGGSSSERQQRSRRRGVAAYYIDPDPPTPEVILKVQCSRCSGRFQNFHILRHHQGFCCDPLEKPNLCTHCGKRFKDRLQLVRHYRSVHQLSYEESRTLVYPELPARTSPIPRRVRPALIKLRNKRRLLANLQKRKAK